MTARALAPVLVAYDALTPGQVDQLRQLEVEVWQQQACGRIETALEWLITRPSEAVTGWALLVDDRPLAFLMLLRAPCAPRWAPPASAVVQALQVDRRFQRQGIGRACLEALPAVVRRHWPGISQLALAVDPCNTTAVAFYRALGWVDAGQACRAKVGYERAFTLAL